MAEYVLRNSICYKSSLSEIDDLIRAIIHDKIGGMHIPVELHYLNTGKGGFGLMRLTDRYAICKIANLFHIFNSEIGKLYKDYLEETRLYLGVNKFETPGSPDSTQQNNQDPYEKIFFDWMIASEDKFKMSDLDRNSFKGRFYSEPLEAIRAIKNSNVRIDFIPSDNTKLMVWDRSDKEKSIAIDGDCETNKVSSKISKIFQNFYITALNRLKLTNRNLPPLKGKQNNFMIGSFANTINDNKLKFIIHARYGTLITPARAKVIYHKNDGSDLYTCSCLWKTLNLKHIINCCRYHSKGILSRHNNIANVVIEAIRKELKVPVNYISFNRGISIEPRFTKNNQPFKIGTFRPDIYFWDSNIEKHTITLNLIEIKSPFAESKKDEVDIRETTSTLDEVKRAAEAKYNKHIADIKNILKSHLNIDGSIYNIKVNDYQFVIGSLGCAHKDSFVDLQNLLRCKNKQKTSLYLKRMIMKAINGSYKIWCEWRYQKQKAWAIKKNLEQNYKKIEDIIEANYIISEKEIDDLEKEELRQMVNVETGQGFEEDEDDIQENIYNEVNDTIYEEGVPSEFDDNDEDTIQILKEEKENEEQTDANLIDEDDRFIVTENDSEHDKDAYSFNSFNTEEFLNDIIKKRGEQRRQKISLETQITQGSSNHDSSDESLQSKTPRKRVKSQRSFYQSDQPPCPRGSKSQLSESQIRQLNEIS
jgi:hypothetical protein